MVIGAGLAGLAAATALAARGHEVTVIEGALEVGGRVRRLAAAGAKIDLGPTVLVDLDPLRALLSLGGTTLRDAVPVLRLDPALLATFPDGAELRLHADPARLATELEALGLEARRDWERLLDLGHRAARLADHYYARGDVAGVGDLLRFLVTGGVSARDLAPFARHRSLARLLGATVRTPALRALLGHCARFVGLSSAEAPAVTLVIPYLLATAGVFYPLGGMASLPEALRGLATKLGAVIETGDAARGLELAGGRVRAVRTESGRRLAVDGCVAAVDPAITAGWLPGHPLARRLARLRPSLAAAVAWWVVEGEPKVRAHHSLHFGDGEPLYVADPGATDPGLAPPGHSVVYALTHHPVDASPIGAFPEASRRALSRLGRWPPGRVLAHGVAGSDHPCYGYAIGPGLFASFRPSQRVTGVENLILAGGGVFPGPGVANVLRSGVRAAALVERALHQRRDEP